MAATYSTVAAGVALPAAAAAKTLLYILNTDATLICKIYRVRIRNLTNAAVTGALSTIEMRLASGTPTGGSAPAIVKHDSASATISTLTVNTGATSGITPAGLLRSITVTSEEPFGKVNPPALELCMICTMPIFTTVWDAGYGFSTVQPITLRQNEGFVINLPASARSGGPTGGLFDFKAEFTFA